MPSAYVDKLVKEGKGSKAELEHKWDKAKKLAADEGRPEEYDYITGIFQKMIGASTEPIRIEASARLKATE